MAISAVRPEPTARSPGKEPISSTSCAAPSSSDPTQLGPRLYGRRRGHKLRPGQRRLTETLLPTLSFALPVDLPTLFPKPVEAIWLEIGFGGGEHLAAQAEAHPGIGFIGSEVFENGIARLTTAIASRGLANIRIFPEDARLLLAALPANSIARTLILFPDPWPKARHRKRRLVAAPTLDELARIMPPGAELRLATDDPDYLAWMLEAATAHPAFRWTARTAADWRQRPADWPPTRYEQKAIAAGRTAAFLRFERIAPK
jgi:tRNA (guanine-N7-)-methyltransferase